MTKEEKFMEEAIALAENGIMNNEGVHFGCIIVKNDTVIGRGNNKVTNTNDTNSSWRNNRHQGSVQKSVFLPT